MKKKCRDCYAPVGADGWKCDYHAAEWAKYTAQYVAAYKASGGKGWEHANCDHANGYCTTTPNNTFQPKGN
jgi:hypothetical protein